MPEFIHSFTGGKMNKDLDERLVPNGEYRDALNLDIANSEGSNVGALQNVKGNVELRGKADDLNGWQANYIEDLSNPVCIGSIRNDIDEKIYWFIASDNVSAIAELDTTTGYIYPILVDKNNILKFSKDYLITGINILDKFLFWTDDQTEPKKINVEKFKAGSCDFNTHTRIPEWNPDQDNYTEVNCGFVGALEPDFTEEDVTVIKKSPLTAPTVNAAASPFGNDIAGTGIDPVYAFAEQPVVGGTTGFENFTFIPRFAADPLIYESLPTYGEFLANTTGPEGNPNHYANSNLPANWNGRVTFTLNSIYGTDPATGESVWQIDDVVFLQGSDVDDFNQSFEYQVTIKIKSINNLVITGEIQAISSDITKFTDPNGDIQLISWEIVLQEKDPMYEYVFPRFAYRWKYIDNEYSAFSPFSEVAFVGNRFKYPSSDGHNIGMTNNIRKLIVESLTHGSEEVDEIEILYKESNNTSVYSIDSIKKKEFSPYNASAPVLPTIFEIKSEVIGKTIEANQLLRPWDNVPRVAKAQEIIANRVVYGNYLQNYTVDPALDMEVTSVNLSHPANLPNIEPYELEVEKRMPYFSLKTIRTYQAGVVFKDAFGRETPVFTNKNASIRLEIEKSDSRNRLEIRPLSSPPSWATHYKFFIKETSNEYYNLALDRFYLAEDGNVWLSFPSSERNKVDEETYLILKKQHDNDIAIKTLFKYKILSIENSAPDFIKTFEVNIAQGAANSIGGFAPDFIQVSFTSPDESLVQNGVFEGGNLIQLYAGGSTDKYVIAGGSANTQVSPTAYTVDLELPLGQDALFLVGQTSANVRVFKPKTENEPEFEGRFFAKINRDFAFDTNIIASFAAMEPRYAILADLSARTDTVVASDDVQRGTSGPRRYLYGWYYQDGGEDYEFPGIDCRGKFKAVASATGDGIVGSEISDGVRAIFGMPKQFGRNLGMCFVGPQSYIPVRGNQNGGGGADGGLSFYEDVAVGGLIRIVMMDGTKTEPYRVERVERDSNYRGAQRAGTIFNCAENQATFEANKGTKLAIQLELPIVEPIGNGSPAALQLIKGYELVREVISDRNKLLTSSNPAIFETEPKEAVDLDLYYEASDAFSIAQYNSTKTLDYYNCFSYGQGVESNRIRDDYNAPTIDKGPKVSAPLDEPYAEERRGSGMIFSQIYNSTSGINRLNQFIQAEPITKDLNPIHGTIQKMHARDTDAIVLCEDKCFRILANKDALFNADGSANVTSNQAVLGQAVPYAGEFGISKNPESFASYGFRAYFSDKNRGAVIRLSVDGITNIAEKGMTDFFNDNLKASTNIIGSYNDRKDLYNLTVDSLSTQWQNAFNTSQTYQLNPDCNAGSITASLEGTTISFKETVDGWTSRKSFIPESGVSINNLYYTFKDGRIYEHGLNVAANNFYRVQYESSFNVLINEQPNVVKGYSTINYTGTRSRRLEYKHNQKFYSIAEINALQAIPTSVQQKTPGWYVNYIKTDLEGGEVKEFEKKEGKYFNYIKGLEIFNDCDFIGDGIDNPDIIDADPQNYILTFTIDPTCSDTGSTTPNTMQYFVNIWAGRKALANNTIDLDIEPITSSAQDVKCAIENFYASITPFQNYAQVVNTGTIFSYVFSDGLQAGTQMYNYLTNEAITQAGAYLFVNTPADQTSDIVNHAGLDANNSTSVPASYYVMILDSNGIINSYTQYNTLASCFEDPLQNQSVTTQFTNQANGSTFNLSAYTASHQEDALLCALRTWMTTNGNAVDTGDAVWGSYSYYWHSGAQGGSDTIGIGTRLYLLENGTYVPAGESTFIYYLAPIPPLTSGTTLLSNGLAPFVTGPTVTVGATTTNVGVPWNGSTSGIPSTYKIVRTTSLGYVYHFKQINVLSPECT